MHSESHAGEPAQPVMPQHEKPSALSDRILSCPRRDVIRFDGNIRPKDFDAAHVRILAIEMIGEDDYPEVMRRDRRPACELELYGRLAINSPLDLLAICVFGPQSQVLPSIGLVERPQAYFLQVVYARPAPD
jgi:hypothetical protein